MRRTYNTTVDARTSDCVEFTRRLYKNITDVAKRLDEQRSRALTVTDIFIPSGEVLRVKLKDYCERLIFKDPVGHGRKTEELLWRKGFYDIVYAAKKLRKNNAWSDAEKALLFVHLAVGIGFYHHLILRLQLEYGLDLVGVIDFAFTHNETGALHTKNKNGGQSKINTEEMKQCVMRLIHRSLVCLGDLTRYKLELDPNWDPMIANRYYKMAICIDPNIGMSHNQLGTVAGNKNYGLDAVYYYMRCVLCSEPFEGAEGNLKRAIITYSTCSDDKCSVQHCISRLLSLLQLWDCEIPNSDRVNQECQDLLNDIEFCLSMEQVDSNNPIDIKNDDNIENYLQSCRNENVSYLTDEIIFKIVAICLMSISKLKSKESTEVHGVIAITLAILSQLVQFAITRIQESLIDVPSALTEVTNNKPCSVENDVKQNMFNNSDVAGVYEEQKKEKIGNPYKGKESTDLNNIDKNLNNVKQILESNGNAYQSTKKTPDKTKSLLTKLRRRKRRNSSDSEGSDINQMNVGSSSDEANTDISETEDDILSEGNILSDDGLSDEITDEEGISKETKIETVNIKSNEQLNGENNIDNNTTNYTETVAFQNGENTHLQNGGSLKNDDKKDLKVMNEKESIENSKSTTTITANINSGTALDEIGGSINAITYVAQLKKHNLKPNDSLKILEGQGILASIKICCDWLRSNHDIIRLCARSSKILLKRITILLNLININTDVILRDWDTNTIFVSNTEDLQKLVKLVPLPEDLDLRGVNILEDAQKSLNWKILHKCKMNKQMEILLRALKLIEFGHYLSSTKDSGIKYDNDNKLFITINPNISSAIKGDNLESKDSEANHSRGKLMRHMGRLWLKAEVRALETRLRSRLMSPYLVPDHEALAKHTPALKRLVYAKKFIVVIPTVVVSALDEVKRISGRAREATRWLETQLRKGSRFLRAQRPHERLALPLIKGPRPKDKEAWLFFQIIECCHYLTQQTKVGLTNDTEAPVVTLLTGCSPDEKRSFTFSPDGLAKSAGVNIEHIESFHTKWKASSKSHG
ncbi:protein SMG5-like [Vespa mandarinia]|uniref:protein SMG5-like n=1 Tax=Vespa mandarinia TaxID=7446 RepID=UPI00161D35B1|nr:protein SMG5-like [Vespa mandarinia]